MQLKFIPAVCLVLIFGIAAQAGTLERKLSAARENLNYWQAETVELSSLLAHEKRVQTLSYASYGVAVLAGLPMLSPLGAAAANGTVTVGLALSVSTLANLGLDGIDYLISKSTEEILELSMKQSPVFTLRDLAALHRQVHEESQKLLRFDAHSTFTNAVGSNSVNVQNAVVLLWAAQKHAALYQAEIEFLTRAKAQ